MGSLLQTMTSTTEDMMETLDGTEMKFNDTDQRVNRKILNIFRATKYPNFLMKSFQSNGSFQQVLPSEEADRFPIFPVLCSVLISYVFVILLVLAIRSYISKHNMTAACCGVEDSDENTILDSWKKLYCCSPSKKYEAEVDKPNS